MISAIHLLGRHLACRPWLALTALCFAPNLLASEQLFDAPCVGTPPPGVRCIEPQGGLDIRPYEDFDKRVRSAEMVTPLSSAVFGDQTGLFTGGTEFSVVDIDIPGNGGPPVQLRRRFKVESKKEGHPLGGFGIWDIDVPHIYASFDDTNRWNQGGAFTQRCSQQWYPSPIGSFIVKDFWSGIQMHIPGQGDREVLHRGQLDHPRPQVSLPGPVQYAHDWLTRDDIRLTCTPIQNPNSTTAGEGFVAIDSQGTQYYFNYVIDRFAGQIRRIERVNGLPLTYRKQRRKIHLMATLVKDRFGNEVHYEYSGNRLTQIRGVDIHGGSVRQIDLSYWGNSTDVDIRVETATAHGKTWSYDYHDSMLGSPGVRTLRYVNLPDGSRWSYTYLNSTLIPNYPNGDDFFDSCLTPEASAQQFNMEVVHPAGATATFQFNYLRHTRTNLPRSACPQGPGVVPVRVYADIFDGYSLTAKTIAGPGIAPMTWTYAYPPACPAGGTCRNKTRTVRVVEPDLSYTEHVFGVAFDNDEGKLLIKRTHSPTGAVLQTETNDYVTDADVSLPPDQSPSYPFIRWLQTSSQAEWGGDNPGTFKVRPLRSTTIARQGVTYASETQAFDTLARPIRVLRTGANDAKTEITRYRDFIDQPNNLGWVVGQVEWTADNTSCPALVDGPACRKISQTQYSTANALPAFTFEFGRQTGSFTHHLGGLPFEVFDPSGAKSTQLTDYHRGIPRSVTYMLGAVSQAGESALVSDWGEITQVTSAVGHSTSFQYDPMGRLERITYPSSDATAWTPTVIDFDPSTVWQYGLAPGHWRHRRYTGAGYTDTYLDGLWRPVMTRTYDGTNGSTEGATRSVVVRQFDHANRETYVSYPQRDVTSVTAEPGGIRTRYDGLGRQTSVEASSELGTLVHAYAYPAAAPGERLRIEVTDPDGFKTLTEYLAYGAPGADWPTRISRQVDPGGLLDNVTTIDRDPWGKARSIQRSGPYNSATQTLSRRFVYDQFQRLCMQFDPESNWRILDYDLSNNVAWTADGQVMSEFTSTCQPGTVGDRSYRSYDWRNRLLSINHPGTTPDEGRTYFLDGALHTLSVGTWNGTSIVSPTSTWTYSYDKRRLLRSETLVAGGQSFTLAHRYNGNGHRDQLTYPDTHVMALAPDALGRPGSAGSYATGAAYWPNGAVSGFAYSNGLSHSMFQNLRLLPSQVSESGPNGTLLNLAYRYDKRANLLKILDYQVAGDDPDETRCMAYDGLGRMTRADNMPQANCDQATGAPESLVLGAEEYTYDALDNLRVMSYPGVLQLRYTVQPSSNRLQKLQQCFPTPAGVPLCTQQVVTHDYGHDARGNLTTGIAGGGAANFATRSHVFDQANRITSVSVTGEGTEAYQYDGHGRRVVIDRGAQRSHQVYGRDGRLLYERAHDGATTRHHYLGSRLVASVGTATGTNYQHTDLLGSPVRKTNAGGFRTHLAVFAPFGSFQREIPAQSAVQGPGFTGHVTDRATSMIYMQQRYYDPIAMRFVSVDPVGIDTTNAENFNRYWYSNNNPYGFVDPDGRHPAAIACARIAPCRAAVVGAGKAVVRGVTATARAVGNLISESPESTAEDGEPPVVEGGPANEQVRPLDQQIGSNVQQAAEHESNARPSSKPKHEKGNARRQRDQGNERGDRERRPPRRPPPDHRGPWPKK